ncbi:hypothetical protein [Arthrobacter crystallopoietes]|uniref:hypothetical protein n=1 Tax=Crystallibacter crystallopoietes TaxID=37928 RepID=UPI00196B9FD1|nr:hypothetical protein [Arthrobacter crystallopoietes]
MSIDLGDEPDGHALIDGVPLIDHHCHGVVSTDLDRVSFEALVTESNWPAPHGTTTFDSQLGFAIRRWSAPVLDPEQLL